MEKNLEKFEYVVGKMIQQVLRLSNGQKREIKISNWKHSFPSLENGLDVVRESFIGEEVGGQVIESIDIDDSLLKVVWK